MNKKQYKEGACPSSTFALSKPVLAALALGAVPALGCLPSPSHSPKPNLTKSAGQNRSPASRPPDKSHPQNATARARSTELVAPIVDDVFSVGELYRVDLVQERGGCVAEVFLPGPSVSSTPSRILLQMNPPCYVRRWTEQAPRPKVQRKKPKETPLNGIGGAQVWEIPIDGTRRRVFTIVGDCLGEAHLTTHPLARFRCGASYRRVMELDRKFYLSEVYKDPNGACALKQDQDNMVHWVAARDP